MPEADAVDIILRLQNLRAFVAGTREAAAGVRGIGKATAESDAVARRGVGGSRSQAGALGLVRKAALGGAGALALMSVEGIKMSTNFDQAMELVHTQAGASQKEVDLLKGQVLDLGKSAPQGPQKLAEGLFHLESIGLRGAKAMDALKVASQGAMVGQANLEETTTALGSAWLSGIKGAGDLHHTMAILNATVGAGNMRMDALVHSLGTGILPSAKVAGLGLKDVMGALAILSDEGYQGSSAMAQLATALHFLYNPTAKATKAMDALGLTQFQLAEDMRKKGLPAALADLQQHLDHFSKNKSKQAAILGDILPGGRGRVLVTLMNQIDRYNGKIRQIQGTSGHFNEAVQKQNQQSANKIRVAWSQVQVALIRFGKVLQPLGVLAAQGFAKIVTGVTNLILWMGKLPGIMSRFWNGLNGPAKIGAEAIGIMATQALALYAAIRLWGLLVAAFRAVQFGILLVRGAFILLQMGSGPLILAFMALVTVAILIATHWKTIGPILEKVWKKIKSVVMVGVNAVVGFVKKHWMLLLTIILGPFGFIIAQIIKHWTAIKNAVMAGARAVIGFVKSYWPILLVILTGPFGLVIIFIVKNWALVKGAFMLGIRAVIGIVKIWWWGLKNFMIKPMVDFVVFLVHVWARILGVIRSAIGAAISFVRGHWRLILIVLTGPIGAAFVFIHDHFNSIVKLVSGLGSRIGHAAKGMWDGILTAFKWAINAVLTLWNHLHFTIGGWHIGTHIAGQWVGGTIPKVNVGMPTVPLLASGGIVTGRGSWITGDAGPELNTMLPGGGVHVQPLTQTQIDTSLAADIAHTTVIQIDKKTIARAVSRFTDDKQARS